MGHTMEWSSSPLNWIKRQQALYSMLGDTPTIVAKGNAIHDIKVWGDRIIDLKQNSCSTETF